MVYWMVENVEMDDVARKFLNEKVQKVDEFTLDLSYDYWTACMTMLS